MPAKTKAPSTPASSSTPKEEKKENLLIAPNSTVTVKLAWTQIAPAYQKALQHAAQHAKVDGFRQGKVPLNMVEGMVDRQKLYEQALDELLPAAYSEALKASGKQPISQPEIEPVKMEHEQDWEFTIAFAERPEVKLEKYQELVKKAKVEAEKEIKELEKKAEEAKKTTEKAKDSKAEAKEEKKAPTPEVKPLTDTQKDDIRLKHIFRELSAANGPRVPEILVRAEVNRELRRLVEQLEQLHLSVEDYLRSRQTNADQLRQEYTGLAVSTLQLEFLIAEIAKTEKITATEAEIDKALDDVKDLTTEQRANNDFRSYVFTTLVKQKVVKHLLSV